MMNSLPRRDEGDAFEALATEMISGLLLKGASKEAEKDAARTKAAIFVKTLIAAMVRDGLAVVTKADLHAIQLQVEVSEAELLSSGMKLEQVLGHHARTLAAHVGERLLSESLISAATKFDMTRDPPLHVGILSAIVFAPGSAAQAQAQAAADRSPAATLAKIDKAASA